MLPITQYYRDVFVKSYESDPDSAVVDISALIEESKIQTPLPLPYNNKSDTLRNLPAAVIIDFCNLHRAYKLLPTNLIRAMTAVILGDTDDIVAARIFVSHIVQSDIDLDYFSYLIMQADSIRIKRVLEEDERKWIDMSKKVFEHKQINEAINECLKDFNENPSADDDELKLNSIGVNLICSDDIYLRGFVGIGEIFININHFRKKIDDFKGDGDLLELIAKMDIISVTIHELAHLRFRQCRNDFHIPTPMTAQQVGLGKSTFEFGAYVERKLFNKQVDWFKSKFTLDVQYMERFITGIEEQTTLPTGFIQGALPRAEVKQIDGLDIGSEAYLC